MMANGDVLSKMVLWQTERCALGSKSVGAFPRNGAYMSIKTDDGLTPSKVNRTWNKSYAVFLSNQFLRNSCPDRRLNLKLEPFIVIAITITLYNAKEPA